MHESSNKNNMNCSVAQWEPLGEAVIAVFYHE